MATTPHARGRRALRFARLASPAIHALPSPVLDQPDELVPGTVEPWEATAPTRPDTAFVRAPRFADLAGELVSALIIIAGGVFAYGFVHLG